MLISRIFALFIAFLLTFGQVFSQGTVLKKEDIPTQQLNNLFQGRIYSPSFRRVKGSQYLTENWRLGDVFLMDQLYRELPIWYDIYVNDLVMLDGQGEGYGFIKLVKDYVKYFEFDNRLFINPSYGRYGECDLGDGYYEVLFEDKISFLMKRSALLDNQDRVHSFIRADTKVLIKDGRVYRLSSKRSFMEAVDQEYKKDVSKFINKNVTKIKKADESEWLKIIRYYNQLLDT